MGAVIDIPSYNDRIVAFIDILGFREIVKNLKGTPELHKKLYYALKRIAWIRNDQHSKENDQDVLAVSVFSDSIAISCKPETKNIVSLISVSGWLQADLLMAGILTRGGIAIGPTIHQEDMIYGEGMIRAYRLESSAAFYPRIVIDEFVMAFIPKEIQQKYLVSDVDYLSFINPFAYNAFPSDAEELASDGYDPRDVYFNMVKDGLIEGRNRCREIDHIAKWDWMDGRYGAAHDSYRKSIAGDA